MGVNLSVKHVIIDNRKILLQIWDLASDNQFEFLLPSYARGTSGAIFMYDITNEQSLFRLKTLYDLFENALRGATPFPIVIVVGSKIDLKDERKISERNVIEMFSTKQIYKFLECSPKTGENVNLVFSTLLNRVIDQLNVK